MRTVLLRLLGALPALAGVILVTFLLTRVLPGDTASYFAGPTASAESIAQIRAELGLDRPLPEQFFRYVTALAQGDLGMSLTTGQPVLQDLAARLPASVELTLAALLLAMGIAIPLGILAAVKQGSWAYHLCRIVVTAGVSLPVFFTGLLLVYVFYYLLGVAPDPTGRLDVFAGSAPNVTGFLLIDFLLAGDLAGWWAAAKQLMLPALTMALFVLAPIARITRASMLTALGSDFVRTARSIGLPSRRIVVTYALRNAVLPVLTILGIVFSTMLGANVLVEKVFSWPGVASYALDALLASDYAPVQGFVLLMASIFVLVNLVVDLLYSISDPRISIE